jgi:hypothetical protein
MKTPFKTAKEQPMITTRSQNIAATRVQRILLASVLSLWSMPLLAQAQLERLSDKDVKTLIDQVDVGRDKFEGNLDGEFKASTVRGSSGVETKVAGALQDYQDNTQKLKDDSRPTTPPAPRLPPSSSSPRPSTRSCKARQLR